MPPATPSDAMHRQPRAATVPLRDGSCRGGQLTARRHGRGDRCAARRHSRAGTLRRRDATPRRGVSSSTCQGLTAAIGTTTTSASAAADPSVRSERARRGRASSRIAMSRPSSSERWAIATPPENIGEGAPDASPARYRAGARRSRALACRTASTMSSHARSRSRRNSRTAIQASGLNQNTAQASVGNGLRQTVTAPHVRQLVEQHRRDALVRPRVGLGRQHDRRPHHAARHRAC